METEKCFKLWVKTIFLLSKKMMSLWINDITLTCTFHSAELSKLHYESMWFNSKWEDFYIWDELSFYKNRWNKSSLVGNFETKYCAILIINI
jgi:hypothetical protein